MNPLGVLACLVPPRPTSTGAEKNTLKPLLDGRNATMHDQSPRSMSQNEKVSVAVSFRTEPMSTCSMPTIIHVSQRNIRLKLVLNDFRRWSETRGKQLPPPPVGESIMKLVEEWFSLVDDDGSGQLDETELALALKAARYNGSHGMTII